MPNTMYNEFKRASAAGEVDLDADDIRVALLMTNTNAGSVNDGINFVGDISLDEMDDGAYVRKALASKAVVKDDPNDRAEFTADDVIWSALGNGTRNVAGVLVYKHVTNDADSVPIAYVEFAVSQAPGGADFTVEWPDEGILNLN